MRGVTWLRDAAGHEPDVTAEVVGGAKVDEALLDRRLAEEHRDGWAVAGDLFDARDDETVEPREVVRRTTPGDRDLAISGCERGRCLGERAVLHDEASGEHCCEHGGPRDHADGDEQQALAAAAQAGCDQAEREPEPAKRVEHQYTESTGV